MKSRTRIYVITILFGLQLLSLLAPWVGSSTRPSTVEAGYELSDGRVGLISLGIVFAFWLRFSLSQSSPSKISYGFLLLWWGADATYFFYNMNKNANNESISLEWGYIAFAVLEGLLIFLIADGFWSAFRKSASAKLDQRRNRPGYDLQSNELFKLAPLSNSLEPEKRRKKTKTTIEDSELVSTRTTDVPQTANDLLGKHVSNHQRW